MALYEHQCFIPLEQNAILWRYLDLEKFKALLENKALFFCRADKFIDPFEGSLPKIEAEYSIKEQRRNADLFEREFVEEQALKNISGLKRFHQKLKRGTIINCWHINNNESNAMWQLYLKDNEGVAIQTTKEKLYKVIESVPEKIGLSKARYLNYETGRWYHAIDYPQRGYNFYIPLVHKRVEYQHENEFRLIHDIEDAVDSEDYWEQQPNYKGKFISVDILQLIEKVYLPPTVDSKAALKIEQISKDLGYNFLFEKSKLSNEPLY